MYIAPTEHSSQSKAKLPRYVPTAAERATLSIDEVTDRIFRAEHITEGKIAVNEDSSTPVFSPYAGRVVKLLAKPSDMVERGQPLFVVEATDTVQGLNDFVAAMSALNTARSGAISGRARRSSPGEACSSIARPRPAADRERQIKWIVLSPLRSTGAS
ncbi:hypothetical protein BBta_3448 [Bradyrhizobium sp. BTAi1]|jgi:multidrug efflux pump subunit AcrA (membrane-fusion protein)|nr:hypothetical protein BBta_3448 [Bradyrhizobium sp. BTAi1]